MMSGGCFVSNMVGADTETMVHVVPHDGSSGFAGGFLADDGVVLTGQLQQLVRPDSPQSTYSPFPSDVTVALPPTTVKLLAGEPDGSWILQEQYHCPTWFSGDGFRDPFTAAAREVSLRLAAQSSSTGTAVSLPDHSSSDVSCSGLTHASSSAGHGLFQLPPYCSGGDELGRVFLGPPHFSQVLSRSGYAHIVQETLDEFVGCLLQDVGGATGSAVGDVHLHCPLPSSRSSITMPSNQSMRVGSEEHSRHKLRNDLLKLLQLVSLSSFSLSWYGFDLLRYIYIKVRLYRKKGILFLKFPCGKLNCQTCYGRWSNGATGAWTRCRARRPSTAAWCARAAALCVRRSRTGRSPRRTGGSGRGSSLRLLGPRSRRGAGNNHRRCH
jgi:hypothetical protein